MECKSHDWGDETLFKNVYSLIKIWRKQHPKRVATTELNPRRRIDTVEWKDRDWDMS